MKKGSKMTSEQRKRVSEAHMGSVPWNKGKSYSAVTGSKNPRWSGGKSRKEVHAKYRAKNPEKVAKWKKDYHERNKSNPSYLLAINIRKSLLKKLGRKTAKESQIELVGCSINELRFYIEGKFTEGMTWENHGTHGWHIDHEIPLFMFDLTNEEQKKSAFHYTNLQPLWAQDNLIKGERLNFKYERS